MWRKINKLSGALGKKKKATRTAIVLSGGGARASYQAGVLQYVADRVDMPSVEIITGVSAGSINAAHLANDVVSFRHATGHITRCWSSLTSEDVYEAASSLSVFLSMIRRSSDDDQELLPRAGLVDTTPMASFLRKALSAPDGRLSGIGKNVKSGRLRACAFVTTDYSTGQTVTWIEGDSLQKWERPNRISKSTHLTVDHIMASTSLPFLFPAIQLNDHWFGDGGIRQAEPLGPAVHLGADRILAISTRYARSKQEADAPLIAGYPPAAQIFGVLLNAVFLDRLDQDALALEKINELISDLPPWRRRGLRSINLLVIRPSQDLGKLSADFQHDLKGILNLISRGLGSKDTKSPDWLSMILFDPAYTMRLTEVGYEDARRQHDVLARFLDG